MKLNFIYSKVYFKNLNRHNPVERTWEEVIKIGKEFEEKYKKEIDEIIKIIPKIVGKPWKEKTKDVYIVDWLGPSFSRPLTLKVRKSLLLMLVILTHELLHNFYLNESDVQKVEKKINHQTEKIFEGLNINAEKQMKVLWSFYEKRFKYN